MTPDELTTASARLRDGSRFDGQLIDANNPDLLRHCADLFRLRDPLAALLELEAATIADLDTRLYGSRTRATFAIAQAINGNQP
jgi:hypothetical protein